MHHRAPPVPYPIPSLDTIATFLKLFPPSNPIYVRLIASHFHTYSDADLFTLIDVSPEEIEYVSPRFADKWDLVGRVVGGDWDRDPIRYDEASFVDGVAASFHPSLEAHFLEGVPWEETPFIEDVLQCVRSGTTTWTCDDESDVMAKCERVDRLYERITTHGYLTQRERRDANMLDLKETRRSRIYELLKAYTVVGMDEVTVNIGRDGELLRFSGKHRLSIAKILELDAIPVLVLARHSGWQEVRDAVSAGSTDSAVLPAGGLEHPDLRDLAPRDIRAIAPVPECESSPG